ncbi:AMP-binding protein [Bradyrhizobium sp. 6(2017)]|uniref:AMP-binding protein n=1 Tax=Bradyrhizobium sp. 6(2017) TaxID=1197460 RepID=UPI0013E10448|nr:AMP-binding protein [Bradyrhizobium sp. 6(2017)]QIG97666.1 AMP-binding protein [Bradyrhizobium sp. 6(2017)]
MAQDLASDIWHPSSDEVSEAGVSRLMKHFGITDFDDLYRFSIDEPSKYWDGVNAFCGVVWSKPYDRFVDLTEGPEFPRWFVGGELNWVDSVLQHAEDKLQRDRPAVIAENEAGEIVTATYAELRRQVEGFAAGLTKLGIRPGDRVGLLMESGIEAVVSLLAVPYIGAIVVPLFSGFEVDAVCSRLSAAGARAIIGTSAFYRRGRAVETGRTLAEAASRLAKVEYLILKGSGDHSAFGPKALNWRGLIMEPPSGTKARRMSANDPFMIIFTSGTTGKPKGIVHTHGGFPVKIVHDATVFYDLREGDRYLWPADMGWVAGPIFTAATLMRGATMICYDGAPDAPDWSRVSRLIERHQVTHLGVSPTLIRGLAAHEAQACAGRVDSIRLMITSGEAIAPEPFNWFRKRFGNGKAPLINYTGGTEASGALLASVIVKPIRPAGFNTVSPGIAAFVASGEGACLVGAVGELALAGPYLGMTQAFWEDRERYLDTYWRSVPGLWVHGDLAIEEPDGHFFLLGRSDDTIKVAGKRLGPAEVEDVLLEMPEISEAAAIGIDDASKGQRLVVFVVPTPQPQLSTSFPTEASDYVAQRLGRAFRPSVVHVVGSLPKTRSSKVMRRVLRNIYTGSPPGDLSSLDNPASIAEIERLRAG